MAAASDKVYQLLAQGRWFSPASSATNTGRHDIAESGIKHQNSNSFIHNKMASMLPKQCYTIKHT
jgi:hypothetical protein